MKDVPHLIPVKQVNGHVCKLNPWQIVRVDERYAPDGLERFYSITTTNSQIIEFSPIEKGNEEIVKFIDPPKTKKVL